MGEPMHRVTQTFRDAALERAYLDHSAAASRRTYRIVAALCLLGIPVAWGSDAGMFGSVANVEVIHRARIVQALGCAAAVAFGYAPAPWFRRGWRVAIVLVTAVLLTVTAVTGLWLPDLGAVDLGAAYISVIALLVASSVIMPIGVVHVVAMNLVVVPVLLVVALTWPGYDGDAAGWLVFAFGTSVFAGYQVNLRDRLAFAAQYRLDEERARSERLLRNVLPASIAERLKAGESPIADRCDGATVLFADLVGFTTLAQALTPEQLVDALDDVFTEFDEIAARHGLEKIKTIGDAYLVAGGVPTPRDDHADAVAAMALEMRDVIATRQFGDGQRLQIRIGLHSGPLVAGVIGKQKFIYDLWGDTVNTASRMESSGVPGEIQVTEATEALLRARFTLTARGPIAIKGKGELETWLLEGPRRS